MFVKCTGVSNKNPNVLPVFFRMFLIGLYFGQYMMLLGKPIKIIRLFSVSSRLSLYLPEYKNAKNMSGNHNHAHLSVENTGRAFVLGIALNIVFVAVEAGAGL